MIEKIEKIYIPDDHAIDWIQTLHEGGFTDKEIDAILSNLNATYDALKKKEKIEKELTRMDEEIKARRGSGFTTEELGKIREGIESRFK